LAWRQAREGEQLIAGFLHAIGSTGEVVVRRSLRRAQVIPFFSKLPPGLIGMEACGTSHHWARELIGLGHEVRLMPPT
jgi:transposase